MGKLVAIGGGNLTNRDTEAIDKKIIALSGIVSPRVLFVPAASRDDQGYAKRMKQYYRSLGCSMEAIRLFHTKKSKDELHQLFLSFDIIYLGGGSTATLVDKLLELELDRILTLAFNMGKVIVGMSAGANALFTYGYSDADQNFVLISGLNLVSGVFTPHYQKRKCFDHIDQEGLNKIACCDRQAYIIDEENAYYFE